MSRPIFFCDPVVLESICDHTREERLINESNTTGRLKKIWTGYHWKLFFPQLGKTERTFSSGINYYLKQTEGLKCNLVSPSFLHTLQLQLFIQSLQQFYMRVSHVYMGHAAAAVSLFIR